jgi:transposase
MKDLQEQHVCFKFCFKLGKTFTEIFQILQQAYGEDCLSCAQCDEWYRRFKSGGTSIEDDPKSGRPSTSMDDNHEKVLALNHQNHCLTVCEISKEVWTCKSSCHQILTNKLKIRRVATKFVPRLLTDAQKENRVSQSAAFCSFECQSKLSEKCHHR